MNFIQIYYKFISTGKRSLPYPTFMFNLYNENSLSCLERDIYSINAQLNKDYAQHYRNYVPLNKDYITFYKNHV